jgi:hypothetical protein
MENWNNIIEKMLALPSITTQGTMECTLTVPSLFLSHGVFLGMVAAADLEASARRS